MDSGTALPGNERNPVQEPGLPRPVLERLVEISRALSASPRPETGTTSPRAGTGTTSPRAGTGTTSPRAGTGTTSQELEPFLHSLISAAAELTGCEVASILALDESGEQLHFLALPWVHQDTLKAVKVPLATSVAGWVLQNGKPAVFPDMTVEPHHFKGANVATDFATRSPMVPCPVRETGLLRPVRVPGLPREYRDYLVPSGCRDYLAVPIIYRGETLGVLEVVNKAEHAPYTEEDLTILETLASQAAIAIQNAHLVDKLQHFLDEQAQLDRMKSDFIAIASHELRTPLGLVLGHAIFLREFIQPEYRDQLDTIVRNAMRLKEIIDDIANMDNVQRGVASIRSQSISIKRLVEEVMESTQQEAQQKGLTMRSDTGRQDLQVEGDSTKLAIALSNMVKNAITFTNPGGHILILVESIPGFVKVSVMDNGIGIPSKDLPHIFERFYQVESHLTRKHGGMGLGLSVSKVMVELHGGRIWAESVEGKGSNFTFLLPTNTGQVEAASRVSIS